MRIRTLAILTMILAAAAVRLLPHPPNFTPVAAMALFGGALIMNRWLACLLPLAAMLCSDLVLGFHGTMGWVYGALVVSTFLGRRIGSTATPRRIATWGLCSSVFFFLLTNLGVWLAGVPVYPRTAAGLLLCYEMAVPFFVYEFAGTLCYTFLLFGCLRLAEICVPSVRGGSPCLVIT